MAWASRSRDRDFLRCTYLDAKSLVVRIQQTVSFRTRPALLQCYSTLVDR
ncbi:MAG: hypothetical protein SAL07_17800 [Oscillatoria sp. PMC 1051.18]|nr:hypothetical protein [Oscillatoria sp. PMC 1050.18]MEC5031759.1 hypothetical protein [Oscillatoria sp. PMC 1051.18]